jgi:hypothetical protein
MKTLVQDKTVEIMHQFNLTHYYATLLQEWAIKQLHGYYAGQELACLSNHYFGSFFSSSQARDAINDREIYDEYITNIFELSDKEEVFVCWEMDGIHFIVFTQKI